jgi:hypothetical protein
MFFQQQTAKCTNNRQCSAILDATATTPVMPYNRMLPRIKKSLKNETTHCESHSEGLLR